MTDVEGGMSEDGPAQKGFCASLMKCSAREFGTDRTWGDRGAWRAMFGEFIATMMFVFAACGVTITTTVRNGMYSYNSAARYFGISLCLGCLYIGLQFVVMPHQGHVNPALTLAVAMSGEGGERAKKSGSNRVYLGKLVMYWMGQFSGAIIGATICLMAIPEARARRIKDGLPTLKDNGTWQIAMLSEIVLSGLFFFCFMIISYYRTTPKKTVQNNQPIGAGAALILFQLMGFALSGAAMNPARYIGPALVTNQWDDWEVYVCGPMVGAVLASIVYTCFGKSRDVADEEKSDQ